MCAVEAGNWYSKTMRFDDVNYTDASREVKKGIFNRYAECLNTVDPNMALQITILTKHVDLQSLERDMFYRFQGNRFDKYRREINEILTSRIQSGQSDLICEKYVTYSVSVHGSQMEALRSLNQLETTLSSRWKSIGCVTHVLSGKERLELLASLLQPGDHFQFDYRDLLLSDLTTKDYIAPNSFSFKEKDYFQFDDHYGCVLFAKTINSNLTDELVNVLSRLPMELVLTIHVSIMDQAVALEMVQRKIAFMDQEQVQASQKAVQQGYNPDMAMSYEWKRGYEEAVELFNDLQSRDQKLFQVTLLAYTWADSPEELNAQVSELRRTSKGIGVTFAPLSNQQEAGINSILPLGRNYVPITRTLTTAATAIMIPFSNQELFQPGGISYGINSNSGNLIIFNRLSLLVANGFILGSPGSGKSVTAKTELLNYFLRDPEAEIFVIDPEREYAALVKALDGSYIHISPGSPEHINPMDINMDYSDDEDPLRLKASFITSLCSTLVGGQLSHQQKSLVDRASTVVYRQYFASHGRKPVPTLADFYDTLKSFAEPEAQDIALALETYIKGSLSAFAHSTNVEVNSRLIAYDVRDLGKELRTLGMLVVLDQIWNRVTRNRDLRKHTYIYIDEIQLLFSNEHCSTFFFELWSRARKYGAVPTGITQNVQTLLRSDDARRMLSNSEFVIALNQSSDDRDDLARILNISEEQCRNLTTSEAGQGLICAGGAIIPFVNRIPHDTELYKLITTKLEEQMIV